MNPLRALPVFCYGLFTLAVQTLLFREFLTAFEGHDISVGLFFGSWFLWIAAGATVTRRGSPVAGRLLHRLDLLLLGYLPAAVLQALLTVHARGLAGAPAYLLLPLRAALPLALVVNAPVGLMTGLLFPLVCRWVGEGGGRAPVAQVYRLEALGSLAGGAGATLLLGLGWPPARLFLLLTVPVALAAAAVRHAQTRGWRWLLLPALLLAALAAGADRPLDRWLQRGKWDRLLPGTDFGGAFRTPQGEYLHGTVQGRWVVLRDGAACEALPFGGGDGRTAALALCQQPRAADILVVGSGLGLCQAFLTLDTVRQVAWAQGDSGFMRQIAAHAPPDLRVADRRLRRLEGDLRTRLTAEGARYDLVILNLPDTTRAVMNRFHTLEAFRIMRRALRPGGVLAVAVGGGANRMGDERLLLGAAMRATLLQVFPDLVLAPGEESWMLAAAPGLLSGDPQLLQARLQELPGAARLFPPAALDTVYQPERAAAAMARYAHAPLPRRLLVNRDARPLATLYGLLLAARQTGARGGMACFTRLVRSGPLALLAPFLALALLRPVAAARATRTARGVASAATWLAAGAGAAGIGITILLMHAYQTRFGSLYLHVGLLSALYMAGLAAGAGAAAARLARRSPSEPVDVSVLQRALILAHCGLLALIGFWPEGAWHLAVFAAAFLLCGGCAGGYFPLAAGLLSDANAEEGQAGGRLETADHLGAAAGSLLSGLLLLPLLGMRMALAALALLLLANFPVPVRRRCVVLETEKAEVAPLTAWLRRLGYLLAGIGLTLLIGHRHWAGPLPAAPGALPSDALSVAMPAPAAVPAAADTGDAAEEADAAADAADRVGESDESDKPGLSDAPGGPVAAAAAGGAPAEERESDDLRRLRTLIREGRLSDHEAEFYRRVEE